MRVGYALYIYTCAVWLSAGGVAYLVEGVRWGMRRIYICTLANFRVGVAALGYGPAVLPEWPA